MPAKLMIGLWKNTRGATMILATLIMVAALGFTAVVVDIGSVALEKQHLQNAIDAASLAAAHDLPDTAKATDTAVDYIEKNGYQASNVTIAFTDNNKVIHITGNKHVDYTFGRILGLQGTTIQPECAAGLASVGGPFKYAVFSGSTTDTLTFSGSDYYIKGSTHTNARFKANGSRLTITGACEAASTISINGSRTDVTTRIPGASVVAMPDLSEEIRKQAEAAGQAFNGNKTFNSSTIDVSKPIYVDGNVTINGSGFHGVGCIFATGSITFNGSSQNVSSSDAVLIYSGSGDITFNGSGATLDGIIYAPNGSINLNGSGQHVNGRVIAETVDFNGSGTQVISSDMDLACIPTTYVRLLH